MSLSKSDQHLAEIYVSQLKQLGLDHVFCDAAVNADVDMISNLIEVAGNAWSEKIEKIQSVYLTRVGARGTLVDFIKNKG